MWKQRGAVAIVSGDSVSNVKGKVWFKQVQNGVVVTADISGLPYSDSNQGDEVFGFHLHEGTSCTGNSEDPFADAKGHYNPNNQKHPYHAGDFPPLFGNKGYAYLSFFTNRFSINEIIGKVVVIHSMRDDFTTQPSGDSGKKIACGKIMPA